MLLEGGWRRRAHRKDLPPQGVARKPRGTSDVGLHARDFVALAARRVVLEARRVRGQPVAREGHGAREAAVGLRRHLQGMRRTHRALEILVPGLPKVRSCYNSIPTNRVEDQFRRHKCTRVQQIWRFEVYSHGKFESLKS